MSRNALCSNSRSVLKRVIPFYSTDSVFDGTGHYLASVLVGVQRDKKVAGLQETDHRTD